MGPEGGDAAVLDQHIAGQFLAGIQQAGAADQQRARGPGHAASHVVVLADILATTACSTARQASALRVALDWMSCCRTDCWRTPWA